MFDAGQIGYIENRKAGRRFRLGGCGLALMMLASCREGTVEDALKEIRTPAYLRFLETDWHKIEFRYVPEAHLRLVRSGIPGDMRVVKTLLDSLRISQGSGYGLTFQMILSPRHDTLAPTDFRNDVIYGMAGKEQPATRVLEEYNFGLKSKIWLEVEGERWELSAYSMQSSGGIEKSRTFMLSFGTHAIPGHRRLVLVAEGLSPGQGRERIEWTLPVSRFE